MKKLCYIATIPAVVHAFLRSHILVASKKYQVTVICNETEKYLLDDLDIRLICLPIHRKPSPWHDLLTLFQLISIFRRERFDIVHSIMPKTGLLAMTAGWLTGTCNRFHTFTGQVWLTKLGIRRLIFKKLDWLTACLATTTLVDSPSQREFLVKESVISWSRSEVIGYGSICGVDPTRFQADVEASRSVRQELLIALESKVILFVGRLNRDKGMLDLAVAFSRIADQYNDTVLLLVGAEEDVSFEDIRAICHNAQDRVYHMNFTPNPERYMAAADVFCLPSYREGFGLTIIEAAACGLPSVASRIYGVTDAVENDETGLLFEVGDVDALTATLITVLINEALRLKLGTAARKRACEQFSVERITSDMLMFYDKFIMDDV